MLRNTKTSRQSFVPPRRVSKGEAGNVSSSPSDPTKNLGSGGSKSQKQDLEGLKRQEKELDEKIEQLESKGYDPEQLKEYINLFHKYNEAKDAAQSIMGRIAILECVPIREIAIRYNAPTSD